eukprot:5328772-Karenia_brevis.AAC.1
MHHQDLFDLAGPTDAIDSNASPVLFDANDSNRFYFQRLFQALENPQCVLPFHEAMLDIGGHASPVLFDHSVMRADACGVCAICNGRRR